LHPQRQRVALCRNSFVLNQRAKTFGAADRARAKPDWAFEGDT